MPMALPRSSPGSPDWVYRPPPFLKPERRFLLCEQPDISQDDMMVESRRITRMQHLRKRADIRRPNLRLVELTPPLAVPESTENDEYQAVIDETLLRVHSQYYLATS